MHGKQASKHIHALIKYTKKYTKLINTNGESRPTIKAAEL